MSFTGVRQRVHSPDCTGRGPSCIRGTHSMAKLKDVLAKEIALFRCRRVDTSSIRTIGLALGPQRNLTTLTGSLLFLHPHCQVLNHAGIRIFGDRRLDFIGEYSPVRLERFLRFGICISREPYRSAKGGSITSSHAFADHAAMRQAFERSGLGVVREDIQSLFWKESIRTVARLRERAIDIGSLVSHEPRLRFVMPVRNPLDCAMSNLRRGLGPRVWPAVRETVGDSIRLVLDELAWVRSRELEYPDHFFHFFEYELDQTTLQRLADFLCLENFPEWMENALPACEVHTYYKHSRELQGLYRQEVENRFSDDPVFARGLLRFVDSGEAGSVPDAELEGRWGSRRAVS